MNYGVHIPINFGAKQNTRPPQVVGYFKLFAFCRVGCFIILSMPVKNGSRSLILFFENHAHQGIFKTFFVIAQMRLHNNRAETVVALDEA